MYDTGYVSQLGTTIYYFAFILWIMDVLAHWMIFEKAGEAGWKSLIPIYNNYVAFKIVWGNGWMFLTVLIPIVGFIFAIIYMVKLAKAFGQGGAFIVGLILLPYIFQLILGFGSAEYIGPGGEPLEEY